MLGIVLCGGESLRMGEDKGLLIHGGTTWAQLAAAKLKAAGLDVKCSVNAAQRLKYLPYFNEDQLIKDDISPKLKGPLLGVLSAHAAHPDEDLFLLACDLLLMESGIIEKLIQTAQSATTADAFIYLRDGEQEPLCGIYRAKGLKKISRLLHDGELKRHSMKFVLSHLEVCESIAGTADYRCFGNFNSRASLEGL